jgi:hypothetical protein
MLQLTGLLICLCGIAAGGEVRTWTKVQGGTIQAQFLREVDGEAVFLQDGKPITIPLDQLIEQDQKLIRELEKEKKVEETPAPLGAPAPKTELPPRDAPQPNPDRADNKRPSLVAPRLVPEMRNWHEITGKQHTAKFTRIHDGNVVLTRAGGRISTMPFASLSREDQQYIRSLLSARGEGHLCPPADSDNPVAAGDSFVAEAPAAPEHSDGAPDLTGPMIEGKTRLHELTRNRVLPADPANDTPFERDPSAENTGPGDHDVAALPSPVEASEAPAPRRAAWPELPKLTGRQIGAGLCVLTFGLIVGSAIGSVILRAAISMFNALTGVRNSRDAVPEPTYGEGMGIIFVTMLVNAVAGVVAGIAVGFGCAAAGVGEQHAQMVARIVSMPLGIVVMSSMFSSMLPTTFLRALLITICYMIVWIFIIAVIVVGAIAVFGFRGS